MEGSLEFIWLVLVVIFILLEFATVSLVSIWFAIGSVAGLIAAALGLDFIYSFIVALAVSILSLIFTRPFLKKVLKIKDVKTNVSSLIGKTAVVVETITPNQYGAVKVFGQTWTAKGSAESETYVKGMEVGILAVEGVKLIISKK